MTPTYTKLLARIDKKKEKLDSLRPLPDIAVQKLREHFQLEMTYNSTAIEGNSLTYQETFWVVSEGITVHGKPLKDHLETQDHHEALRLLYSLVSQDSQPTISEHLIRTLHQVVVQKTDTSHAGKYRSGKVFIAGTPHSPPDAIHVNKEMNDVIAWTASQITTLHPVQLAALLHHKLVHIHPFFDGNGRTARLVMNLILLQQGYPLAVILKNDRKKYYRVLAEADAGNMDNLLIFIAQSVERSLDIYIKTLTQLPQKTEKYLTLSETSTHFHYSGKYLNLLARQGKLEAHKQGRNWLTSKEAVQRYIDTRERNRSLPYSVTHTPQKSAR